MRDKITQHMAKGLLKIHEVFGVCFLIQPLYIKPPVCCHLFMVGDWVPQWPG